MGRERVKVRLKADKAAGRIEIDELTCLHEIPPVAWDYRLGHRSALKMDSGGIQGNYAPRSNHPREI